MRLREDAVEQGQQLVEEGRHGRGGADCGGHRLRHDAPEDPPALLLEGHGALDEVPSHGPQRAQPLGTEDDVEACQRHDKEVGDEGCALDGERCLTEDTGAGDPLAIGDHGGEARPGQ